jgi:hypothetical protein
MIGHTKTTWKRHGKLWLPSSIDGMSHNPPIDRKDNFVHTKISLDWKTGDELGAKPIIDVNADDWREPIRRLFDEEWNRPGLPPARDPLANPDAFLETLNNEN